MARRPQPPKAEDARARRVHRRDELVGEHAARAGSGPARRLGEHRRAVLDLGPSVPAHALRVRRGVRALRVLAGRPARGVRAGAVRRARAGPHAGPRALAPLGPADDRALRGRGPAVAGARGARHARHPGLRGGRPTHRRRDRRRRVEGGSLGTRARRRPGHRPAGGPPRPRPGVVPRVRRQAARGAVPARCDPPAPGAVPVPAHVAAPPLRGRPAVASRHAQHDGALRRPRARSGCDRGRCGVHDRSECRRATGVRRRSAPRG